MGAVAMRDDDELVPLRPGFDLVMRGYRRSQVKQYMQSVEQELALVAADRDANATLVSDLTRQVEDLRAQNAELRRKVDQMCATPIDPAAVPLRLRRTVELAKQEAAEITARAQAAAENCWAGAEEAAERLRGQYIGLLGELDSRRTEMEAEHRTLMRQTQVEVDAMTTAAERRSAEIDGLAERRRAEIESDFEVAMAARRTAAMREIAEQREAAKIEAQRTIAEATTAAQRRLHEATTEAERLVHTAKTEAEDLIESATATAADTRRAADDAADQRTTQARHEVNDLRLLRDRVADQLRTARDALADVEPLLNGERERVNSLPHQRDRSPAAAEKAAEEVPAS
jgi:cell division septum initiation protein DivIVA